MTKIKNIGNGNMPDNENPTITSIKSDKPKNTVASQEKDILESIIRAKPILFYNQMEELHMTSAIETWKEKREKDLKKTEQTRSQNSWLWSQASPDESRIIQKPLNADLSKSGRNSPKK